MKNFLSSNKCIKRLTAVLLVSAVLIATTFSAVFADSTFTTSINYVSSFSSIPSGYDTSIYFSQNGNNKSYPVSTNDHTYICGYTDGSIVMRVALSTDTFIYNEIYYKQDTGTSSWNYGSNGYSQVYLDNEYNIYKTNNLGSFITTYSVGIPIYSSLDEAINAFKGYINTPTAQGYTSLEAGNIVYFDLGANKSYDISMMSEFYSYSGVLSGTWPDDNRRYGFVNELPTANTNFAESAGTSILWSDDTDGQTILGTNNKGISSISGTTTGRYMWVINPLYNNKYYDDALNAKAINGVMKIYGVPSGTTVYTYKLKQNATSLGLDNVIPSVSGGVGTVSENEGEQTPFTSTDDNETPYTQTVGGDTSATETVSAIEGVRQTLDQFVNAFLNLLTAPADHIQQLISAGSAFMQAITGIFTWLPNSVVDVFTSALILMIVIGVLKMLL